jgi:hypothetical protein
VVQVGVTVGGVLGNQALNHAYVVWNSPSSTGLRAGQMGQAISTAGDTFFAFVGYVRSGVPVIESGIAAATHGAPFVGSVWAAFELYDGASLGGGDLGRPLGPLGKALRWVRIGADVLSVVLAVRGACAGRPTAPTRPAPQTPSGRPIVPQGGGSTPFGPSPPPNLLPITPPQNASQTVTTRIGELQAAIPAAQRGRITMAVAVVEDSNGARSVLVSSSEGAYVRGPVRPVVQGWCDATVVGGTGHAEANIIAHAQANNLRVIDIGATRPVCVPCQDVINPTGATISTPLRPRPGN